MASQQEAFKGPAGPAGGGPERPPRHTQLSVEKNGSLVSSVIKAAGLSGSDVGDPPVALWPRDPVAPWPRGPMAWLSLSHLFSSECCLLVVWSCVPRCQAPAMTWDRTSASVPCSFPPGFALQDPAGPGCPARGLWCGLELRALGEGAWATQATFSHRQTLPCVRAGGGRRCVEAKGRFSLFSWVRVSVPYLGVTLHNP